MNVMETLKHERSDTEGKLEALMFPLYAIAPSALVMGFIA
jgi:hypothetical protein